MLGLKGTKMNKDQLIKALLDDFKAMFPESKLAEQKALYMRLFLLDEKDLILLLSTIKNNDKQGHKNDT